MLERSDKVAEGLGLPGDGDPGDGDPPFLLQVLLPPTIVIPHLDTLPDFRGKKRARIGEQREKGVKDLGVSFLTPLCIDIRFGTDVLSEIRLQTSCVAEAQ